MFRLQGVIKLNWRLGGGAQSVDSAGMDLGKDDKNVVVHHRESQHQTRLQGNIPCRRDEGRSVTSHYHTPKTIRGHLLWRLLAGWLGKLATQLVTRASNTLILSSSFSTFDRASQLLKSPPKQESCRCHHIGPKGMDIPRGAF